MSHEQPAPDVAGPQTEAAVAPPAPAPAAATAPQVLHSAQRTLLRAVLNRIVPARPGLGGAGDLDVGASIERTLAVSPHLRRLLIDGLQQVAITSQRVAGAAFEDVDVLVQTQVLERVEQRWPIFFAALVEHAYRGYYSLAEVHRAIGFDSRPPQPLGHTLPGFDPALLDRQRQRAPFWRRT